MSIASQLYGTCSFCLIVWLPHPHGKNTLTLSDNCVLTCDEFIVYNIVNLLCISSSASTLSRGT